MKKQLLFTAILSLAAIGAAAAPVTKDRAVTTAKNFLKGKAGVTVTASSVYSATNSYYIINMKPQGWVIVSADDNATPVIGYSTTGQLNWHSLPANMRAMLSNYGREVQRAAVEASVVNRDWSNMSSLMSRAEDGSVDPLIKVHWNQGSPFNYYCPGTGSSKAIVGCVAVAMSQAMSVQQYPPRPIGSMNYTPAGYSNINMNFEAEKAYDWNAIMSGDNNYREAARLLYHAGVSVRMHYGADGSGVPYSDLYLVRDALTNIFQYGNAIAYYPRDQYERQYGKQAWVRLLLNELTAGRAIVYNGTGDAGHSFNIDGYDGTKFHLNWGWGGVGDGYFTLDNLTDAYQGISFPNNHIAIIGIGSPDRELRSVELDAMSIEEGLPAGTVIANVTVNGETPKPGYTFEVRGIYQGGTFQKVPFEVRNNQLVATETLKVATKASYDLDIIVSTSGESPLIQSFTITVEAWQPMDKATSVKFIRSTGDFEFTTKHGASYVLRSEAGATLASGTLPLLPRFTINKATLAAGRNTLEIRRGDEVKTLTIIK